MKKGKSSDTPEFDRDREFAVVLEGLRSEFRVFGEDLVSVKEDLKSVRHTVARTWERVSMIDLTQRKILTTLEGHDIRLGRLEEAVLK